jgi:Mg-chelatase subunit ChlD
MTTTTTMVYGRAAYEGFARAIGSRLGLSVKINDGASACIDANGTIRLPGMHTHQTAEEFAVTCGVIVHELSHQFYRSHSLIDPNRSRLEHDCLNAVLDVADETWVDEWFRRAGNGRPGELLQAINADAMRRNAKAFNDWSNPDTRAWIVLCIGILCARAEGSMRRYARRWLRYTARMASGFGVDAKACARLISKARRAKKQDPRPTGKRFPKLTRLARELAELLKPFAPSQAAAATAAGGLMIKPIGDALAAGKAAAPRGATIATEQDGQDMTDGPVVATPSPAGRGAGGRRAATSGESSIAFDASAYNLLTPSVRRIAQRIATDGEGLDRADALSTGPVLGQAHRLMTDGLCLARWEANDRANGLSVSVLLDCSGSMQDQIRECAGIARSFAQAMREAGAVQSLAFGDGVHESSDDFERVGDMGGTNTHLAIERATDWLTTRAGQRWIVVITDGVPNDRKSTDAACMKAIAQGIRLLAVGLNCQVQMPGAVAATASDPTHLAIELDAAARFIEAA